MEHRLESHINAAETLAQRVQATLGLVRKTNSQTEVITDLSIAHQSSRYRKSGKFQGDKHANTAFDTGGCRR